jgi:hypothetical protein
MAQLSEEKLPLKTPQLHDTIIDAKRRKGRNEILHMILDRS